MSVSEELRVCGCYHVVVPQVFELNVTKYSTSI